MQDNELPEVKMSTESWPPPGVPLVQGSVKLTTEWSIFLPEQFARRVEEGQLVLWRPGLTVYLEAWGNEEEASQLERLGWFQESASEDRFDEEENVEQDVTRYSYRLHDENENGPIEALYAAVFSEEGHLQISMYFDDEADAEVGKLLVDSVSPLS